MAKVTVVKNKENGLEFISGSAEKKVKTLGKKTPKQQNEEIRDEKVKGEKQIKKIQKADSWRNPKERTTQFLVGHDSGVLAWLTPIVCEAFGLEDCGYKNDLSIWNFPPSIDNPKKKHKVTRQYYHRKDERFILVDVFDAGVDLVKVNMIKAWLEALGYHYTWITGADMKLELGSKKFMDLIFKDRFALLNPKDKDYPKFKIPRDYNEAKIGVGGVTYEKSVAVNK